MKFLLLTYDPQGTAGPNVVPFDDEASAFAELNRERKSYCSTRTRLRL